MSQPGQRLLPAAENLWRVWEGKIARKIPHTYKYEYIKGSLPHKRIYIYIRL